MHILADIMFKYNITKFIVIIMINSIVSVILIINQSVRFLTTIRKKPTAKFRLANLLLLLFKIA